ncbi:cytochrome P450 [Apiospora arundinis]|uniref:Cytochrome P450 n=1 Tax=Apiospora arundinis TaxID=335852 RepID=A0ABR2I105_9PEZI
MANHSIMDSSSMSTVAFAATIFSSIFVFALIRIHTCYTFIHFPLSRDRDSPQSPTSGMLTTGDRAGGPGPSRGSSFKKITLLSQMEKATEDSVMFAEWGPMGDLFYGAIIKEYFSDYEDIVPGSTLASLSYLRACIEETLRMLPSNNTSLPRISPVAMVDGQYIPKGALARYPNYFHQPLCFRPERRLISSHTLYDPAIAGNYLKSLYPFSLGLRLCMGREMA